MTDEEADIVNGLTQALAEKDQVIADLRRQLTDELAISDTYLRSIENLRRLHHDYAS